MAYLTVDTYVNYIRDAEFKKYIKRQCEDFAIQSWHTMLHSTSFCDSYKGVKHRQLLEPYLQKTKCKQRAQYHMIMVCEYFRDSSVELFPDLYYSYMNMVTI